MPNHDDRPTFRTFEEFEREELRRSDSLEAAVDDLFEGMVPEDLDFDASKVRLSRRAEADLEE